MNAKLYISTIYKKNDQPADKKIFVESTISLEPLIQNSLK